MDFLQKAKELGKRVSDESARAVSATLAAGSKLKDGIAEKMGADLTAGGFGAVAKKALDKSTEVMLSSSVALFNSVVRRLAEEPKYHLVTNEQQLMELRRQVEARGKDWAAYMDADLVRLRAVFSNAWGTLELGSEINAFLAGKLSVRINEVVRLLKGGQEDEVVADPQALAVIDAMHKAGKVIEHYENAELSQLITSVVSAEQHYFDQVYKGLALAHGGDNDKATAILKGVETRPHYLVHLQLANSRVAADVSAASLYVEIARQCRPGDVNMYETKFGDAISRVVLNECKDAIKGG